MLNNLSFNLHISSAMIAYIDDVPVGGRREEFESMGAEHRQLRAAAAAIDARLKGLDQSGAPSRDFRTLVHGDFKSANLLFSSDTNPVCAAYDFQYCGVCSPTL